MTIRIELGEHPVLCQKWEWMASVREPDGVSLHPDHESLARFITAYWADMPNTTPNKYSRPSGTAYPLGVTEAVMRAVVESGDGIRVQGEDFPGSGGIDGYMPRVPKA